MHTARFLGRRLVHLVIQLWGVVTVTFFFIHLLPGDPADALAGTGASPATIEAIRRQLGLTKPLAEQYLTYLGNVVRGKLGTSIFTGRSVLSDLVDRVPATLELVVLSMAITVLIGIPIGIYSGMRPKRLVSRIVSAYALLTGAIPDFWLGLVLIYIFFYRLGWAPAPVGQLSAIAVPPPHVTGSYVIDSAIAGQWSTFGSALSYLVLPVITLVVVYAGNIVKQARASIDEVANADFVEYARACGLPERVVLRYILRSVLAPVVTVVAITSGFLFGGAVLVETVFSWGGVGEYAVQAVTSSDYAPVTGFVLVAAAFMALIFLVLDILYVILDPRIAL
jgi:ABC-type dipeptide/oligopeptide/nickel transport system permease component